MGYDMDLLSNDLDISELSSEQVSTGQLHSLILQCNALTDHSMFLRILGEVHTLFQYDLFACGIIDTECCRTLYFFNLNFSDESVRDLHLCEYGKKPQYSPYKEWSLECDPLWLSVDSTSHQKFCNSLIKHELHSLAIHGLRSLTGSRASTFFFGRTTEFGNPDDLLRLPLIIPPLHMCLSNIMSQSRFSHKHMIDVPPTSNSPAAAEPFTSREKEVAKWLALGKTNAEIAHILSISTFTVKNHVQKILVKLDVTNRTQAATRAIELGIIETKLFI
jgi:DNA-binding CsgD family transcriptional regulator